MSSLMPLLPIQAEKPYLSDRPVVQLSSLHSGKQNLTAKATEHVSNAAYIVIQTQNHAQMFIDVHFGIMLICTNTLKVKNIRMYAPYISIFTIGMQLGSNGHLNEIKKKSTRHII